jgi:hypothetical protein
MSEVAPNLEPAKILWTGGWDSTFQLLHLLFSENRCVEPYYLLDEGRQSTGTELLAMKRIRKKIFEIDEPAAALLLPTKYFAVSAIPSNPAITQAYDIIRNDNFIGTQYDWLPRFCEHHGISRLQLCIHKDDKAAVVVEPLSSGTPHDKRSCQIANKYVGTNEYILFKYFDFPILGLTKTDMASIASQRGWTPIMEMTCFCHRPIRGKPCGRCNPCKYTIEEGLAWRIPLHRRLIGRVFRILAQPTRVLVKKMLVASTSR